MPGPALISAGVSVIGGLIGAGAARRRARAAARKARALAFLAFLAFLGELPWRG